MSPSAVDETHGDMVDSDTTIQVVQHIKGQGILSLAKFQEIKKLHILHLGGEITTVIFEEKHFDNHIVRFGIYSLPSYLEMTMVCFSISSNLQTLLFLLNWQRCSIEVRKMQVKITTRD